MKSAVQMMAKGPGLPGSRDMHPRKASTEAGRGDFTFQGLLAGKKRKAAHLGQPGGVSRAGDRTEKDLPNRRSTRRKHEPAEAAQAGSLAEAGAAAGPLSTVYAVIDEAGLEAAGHSGASAEPLKQSRQEGTLSGPKREDVVFSETAAPEVTGQSATVETGANWEAIAAEKASRVGIADGGEQSTQVTVGAGSTQNLDTATAALDAVSATVRWAPSGAGGHTGLTGLDLGVVADSMGLSWWTKESVGSAAPGAFRPGQSLRIRGQETLHTKDPGGIFDLPVLGGRTVHPGHGAVPMDEQSFEGLASRFAGPDSPLGVNANGGIASVSAEGSSLGRENWADILVQVNRASGQLVLQAAKGSVSKPAASGYRSPEVLDSAGFHRVELNGVSVTPGVSLARLLQRYWTASLDHGAFFGLDQVGRPGAVEPVGVGRAGDTSAFELQSGIAQMREMPTDSELVSTSTGVNGIGTAQLEELSSERVLATGSARVDLKGSVQGEHLWSEKLLSNNSPGYGTAGNPEQFQNDTRMAHRGTEHRGEPVFNMTAEAGSGAESMGSASGGKSGAASISGWSAQKYVQDVSATNEVHLSGFGQRDHPGNGMESGSEHNDSDIHLDSLRLDFQPEPSRIGVDYSREPNGATSLERSVMTQISQIVRHIRLSRVNGVQEMQIELKPDWLGDVKIRVAVERGLVTARFTVENQQVKALVETGLPWLRDHLSQQGLQLADVSVDLTGGYTTAQGENNSGFNWQSARESYPQNAAQGQRPSPEDATGTAPVGQKVSGGIWGSRVDYLV